MAIKRARVSSRDVARAANVSLNTVSLVVRDSSLVAAATKARVRAVIAELGYRPHAGAAALRSARSQTLGYVVEKAYAPAIGESYAAIDVFHNQLINAITARAQASGYYLLLDAFIDAQRCLSLVDSRRIDGVLLDLLIGDDVLEHLRRQEVPVVLVGRDAGELPVNWVKADEEAGAYEATRHLLSLGHRRLALLTVVEQSRSAIVEERERGYYRAIAEAGLGGDELYVAHGDYTFASGYEQGIRLLRGRPRPSAFFIMSEIMAAGTLQAAQTLDLDIPGEVAIVTSEDSPLVEYVRPRLTAVHVPMYQVGTRATEVLLSLLQDPSQPPQQIVLPTRLVVRESTVPSPTPDPDRATRPLHSYSPAAGNE